jgi:L-lactate dehydrogenase complex protein LldE
MGDGTDTHRRYPPKPRNAYLFATCLVDQFAPEAGLDAVRLLEREGIAVHFPDEWTRSRTPLKPAARRLRDLLKDRRP